MSEQDAAQCGLSERGALACRPALSYHSAFISAFSRPWRAEQPQAGIINLCVAEDKLSADLLVARLATCTPLPSTALGYDDMRGILSLRTALAAYISRAHAPGVACEPAELCVSAGAGAIFDTLAFTLASPGEAFLIPAPYYAAFVNDLGVRSQVGVLPVHEAGNSLLPSVAALETARATAEARGVRVRGVLLCNPGNPSGLVMPQELLSQLIAWCLRAGLHAVIDEVYAGSVFNPQAGPPFASAMALLLPKDLPPHAARDRLHVVLGFSKDFAASGLRVGVLWSRNPGLLQAWSNLGYFQAVSAHTQHALAQVLDDRAWMEGFMAERHRRLRLSYDAITAAFAQGAVPFVATGAGMFVWLDLRAYLPLHAMAEDERALWRELYDREGGVLLTPGGDCAAHAPGFFRACFAATDPEALPHVAQRMMAVLEGRRRC